MTTEGRVGGGAVGSAGGAVTASISEQPAAAAELLSWVACDSCEKWRRLSEGSLTQYQDKAFHCSFLPGVDCSTPEEPYNDAPAAALLPGKHGRLVHCATCKAALERGQRGREKKSTVLERHYMVVPSCRPLDQTTPATVASRIIDLSDRLPYRAVLRKVGAAAARTTCLHARACGDIVDLCVLLFVWMRLPPSALAA